MLDIDTIKLLENCSKDARCFEKLQTLFTKIKSESDSAKSNLRLLEAAIRNDYDSILITEMDLETPGPTIVYVNDGFTKMTGYSREEIIGKTPRILQGPKTDRAILDRLRCSLIKGKSFFGQTINYRKDGSEFINQWDIHPLQDEKGNITHWVSYQHDITDRKRAELSVFNSNAESDDLYEDAKRTIIDFTGDGKIIGANKSFRELVGYQKEELLGTRIWDLMPLKLGAVLKSRFVRLWNEEFTGGNTYLLVLRHQNGLPIQIEIEARKIELNGEVFVRGDIRNLSLRKRVLNTLKKRNTDYSKLFERKVDFNYGLILDDNNKFRFKWISDGFKNVTGYAVNECLCENGWDLVIHPEDKYLVTDHILKAFDGTSSTLQYRLLTKDGTVKKVLGYAKPDLYCNEGHILTIVASATDVTDQKESAF